VKNFLLILTCVALGVAGQLLLKHGMSSTGERVDEVRDVVPRLLQAATNPAVVGGFLFYALSAALWLVVLTRVELSLAYPMLSLGYVLVVVLSRVFFQEHVTWIRFLGTLVVCFGVFLISRTQ
jgi:multidrug transporter EmrE-like cation transporter